MKERFTEFLINEDGFIEWIGAGLSALGMISDRNERKKDRYANSGVGVRADAKASGFNPLTLLASGARASAGYAPTMGTSLAQAGQALTDWSSNEKALELENARLQMDQQELQSRLEKQTLRPSVAGIYGNSGGTKNGVQNVQESAPGGAPGSGLVFGQSIEADTVYEIESDAYKELIEANQHLDGPKDRGIVPWGYELTRRNFPNFFEFTQRFEQGGDLTPNSVSDRVSRTLWGTQGTGPNTAPDPRMDVWRAQNYGPDYQPTGWRR